VHSKHWSSDETFKLFIEAQRAREIFDFHASGHGCVLLDFELRSAGDKLTGRLAGGFQKNRKAAFLD
jgi:hypothetical protein